MKKFTCFAICFMAAATMLSVTSCTDPEPSITAVTTAETGASGIANPWKEALTLDEAAYGANLNGFTIDEESPVDGAAINPLKYKYTDSLAEATYSYKGMHVIIRKSMIEYSDGMDISGSYHEFEYEWPVDIGSISVTCYGDVNGETVKVLWSDDECCYSILVDNDDEITNTLTGKAVEDLVKAVE